MKANIDMDEYDTSFILMLIVLLILFETRTSLVLYTDMNTDIGANINITNKYTSLIQIELPTLRPILKLI